MIKAAVANRMFAFLCIFCLLGGCGPAAPAPSSLPASAAPAPSVSSAAPSQPATPAAPLGSGSYTSDGADDPIDPQIKALVLDYMDLYYGSLARLELCAPEALAALFAQDRPEQALGNHTVWQYLIETRKLQHTDLTMAAYRYTMETRQMETLPDGSLHLMVIENSVQNFAAHPEVDSECIRVYHSFVIVPEDGGWRLRSHMQLDSLYFTLFGTADESNLYQAFSTPEFPRQDTAAFLAERLQQLLTEARDNLQQRSVAGATTPTAVYHPYDRQAAVAYSQQYADERNADWPDYGALGGNCQNYLSQCLLAGGIPMDPYGDAVWKWYSDTPNNLPGTAGRSAAWSSVAPFRSYLEQNTGFGLSGQVDAPYYSGQPGDFVQMGPADQWRHTVIITQTVQDSGGNTVDYLINSNTADLRDYPVSAYSYTNQSLLRIWGWNDA